MMDRAILENLLAKVRGCTFATIDMVTDVSPGITKEETGKRVLLFTNTNVSGYVELVRRRLREAGKNADNFVPGDLPWGTRLPNSPLIVHKDELYLQVVELAKGQEKYFMLGKETDPSGLLLRKRTNNQGLPQPDAVVVRAPKLSSITRIVLMGEQLVAEAPKRAILRINA